MKFFTEYPMWNDVRTYQTISFEDDYTVIEPVSSILY